MLRFDRDDAERMARYYLGGYAAPEGADPVAAGLLVVEGRSLALVPDRLPEPARAALQDAAADGALDWDEFAAWVSATYAGARRLPETLDALRAEHGAWSDADPAWFVHDVEGSAMTHARRRLYVRVGALRAALSTFRRSGDPLAYPEGTLIVGEHLGEGGAVVETTAKRRRADGFWDFAVYDAGGTLTGATATPPRPLRAPVQCAGCHLGRRRFEPERSFPSAAPPGPAGARAVVVPADWRNAETAALFDEHARRSDGVLGLYATLYTAKLLADRAAGRPLATEDAAILQRLGR